MRFSLAFLCLPLAFVLMTGCGTPPERRLDSPMVEITGLTAPASQPKARVLTIRLANPNTVPLVVNRSTHTLYLDGQRIGRVDDRTPVGVPPLGNVTHGVVLHADITSDLLAHFKKSAAPASATLESAFEILVGTDKDTITLKSSAQGMLVAP